MNIEKEIEKKARELNKFRRKIFILQFISKSRKSVSQECSEFGISKSIYYQWKKRYDLEGEDGSKRRKPIAYHHPNKIPQNIIDKVIELRTVYQLGSIRISWYLERYHDIKISESSVYRILKKEGLNRLPRTASRRTVHTRRYAKKVPGHQVQVDVKFATFIDASGKKIRRFQFSAIDDVTRIRALKMYKRHTQTSAIDFMDYVIEKFPFRIHTVRTDRGHEFQARFIGMLRIKASGTFISKPRSP